MPQKPSNLFKDKTKFTKFRTGERLSAEEEVIGEPTELVSEFPSPRTLLLPKVLTISHLNHFKLKSTRAANFLRSKVDFPKYVFSERLQAAGSSYQASGDQQRLRFCFIRDPRIC